MPAVKTHRQFRASSSGETPFPSLDGVEYAKLWKEKYKLDRAEIPNRTRLPSDHSTASHMSAQPIDYAVTCELLRRSSQQDFRRSISDSELSRRKSMSALRLSRSSSRKPTPSTVGTHQSLDRLGKVDENDGKYFTGETQMLKLSNGQVLHSISPQEPYLQDPAADKHLAATKVNLNVKPEDMSARMPGHIKLNVPKVRPASRTASSQRPQQPLPGTLRKKQSMAIRFKKGLDRSHNEPDNGSKEQKLQNENESRFQTLKRKASTLARKARRGFNRSRSDSSDSEMKDLPPSKLARKGSMKALRERASRMFRRDSVISD